MVDLFLKVGGRFVESAYGNNGETILFETSCFEEERFDEEARFTANLLKSNGDVTVVYDDYSEEVVKVKGVSLKGNTLYLRRA